MATATYRIMQLRRHTALQIKKTQACSCGRLDRLTSHWAKPPCAGDLVFCGVLNVLTVEAVDFAFTRRGGRFFSIFRHSVGCRSPPLLKF